MKLQVLLRKIHHWGSIVIAIPLLVMIGAGVLLQVKKQVEWVQPLTFEGAVLEGVPEASLQDMFEAARAVPEAGIDKWEDLDRADFKPDKGIIKFVSLTRWEVQVDTSSAEVLSVSYRRSDLIESLHDGSFFAGDATKLWLFLPAGIALFVLWLTGMYMFFLPYFKKAQKRKRKNGVKS
ncbi:MAG: PepSY-associated TM helix domain-containing protein [Sphingomonadales bacterium]